MLCIEMVLLSGRYRACSFEDRRRHEWPPEPARLFFAATNAVHTNDPVREDEIAALQWWEGFGAPEISCSGIEIQPDGTMRQSWTARKVLDHFVPGNFASSSTRNLNAHWDKIEQAQAVLAMAEESGVATGIDRASRHFNEVLEKLRVDTAKYTVTAARESAATIDAVLELLPENRNLQPRQFPVVAPDDPRVYFTWPHVDLDAPQASILDGIVSRIARVGHSSSVVSCRVVNQPAIPPAWVPADPQSPSAGEFEIRTMAPGMHDVLVEEFARHQGVSERVMPAVITSYVRPSPHAAPSAHQHGLGDWLVMPLRAGQRLPLARTQDLTRAVRGALMAHSAQPVPSVISGHSANSGDTAPVEHPHMSVLVLPNVSNVYSDGLIHAVAIGLPPSISDDDRSAVTAALQRWRAHGTNGGYDLQLPGGRVRQLGVPVVNSAVPTVEPRATGSERKVASRQFWSRRARCWSSVTPVALDRHPKLGKNPDYDELNAAIAPLVGEMCSRVGLPRPIEVTVSPASVWATVPPVGTGRRGRPAFPQFRVGGRSDRRRFTTHLTIRFAEPVTGPIILGAGRYFGYGLFLPTPAATGSNRSSERDGDDVEA
jgi:CRISPR-associated protein Csb2